MQFEAPKGTLQIESFIAECFKEFAGGRETMLEIIDWLSYLQTEMVAISGIRCSHGERRRLIDAPGHSIELEESEVGVYLLHSLHVLIGFHVSILQEPIQFF